MWTGQPGDGRILVASCQSGILRSSAVAAYPKAAAMRSVIFDVDAERGTAMVRQGKGKKDRMALPCRVRDPDRKGKVESGRGPCPKDAARGLRFEALNDAQAYLDGWEERWADTRIHGTTKRQVAKMFAEEQPRLLALPIEPFRYYQYGTRTVHLDGCVEVDAAYYSAPPGWVGRVVGVQWDGHRVRIVDPMTGILLREHVRQQRGRHRILPEDRAKHTPPETGQLLWRARRVGAHVGQLCVLISLASKHKQSLKEVTAPRGRGGGAAHRSTPRRRPRPRASRCRTARRLRKTRPARSSRGDTAGARAASVRP